jgi:hypothetical protein
MSSPRVVVRTVGDSVDAWLCGEGACDVTVPPCCVQHCQLLPEHTAHQHIRVWPGVGRAKRGVVKLAAAAVVSALHASVPVLAVLFQQCVQTHACCVQVYYKECFLQMLWGLALLGAACTFRHAR